MDNNYKISEELTGSWSFLRVMLVYLAVCAIGIAVMISSINRLMMEHDKILTSQICNLVAEKMNNSIKYMTTSAENMSALISAEEHTDLDSLYEELNDLKGDGYVSLGFIDQSGKIYARSIEIEEFQKWGLMKTAEQADPVSISAPYRSALTGQPVFTLFTNMTYGKDRHGKLFLTYPLKEIQNIAYTESLDTDTEIWLMDPESENIIQCAGDNKYAIGSWANAIVNFEQKIDPDDREAYRNWKNNMDINAPSEAVVYKIGDIGYTQVYADISFMHGWYVVVRIPSSAMSLTMSQFKSIVLIFTALLLTATMVMFWLSHKRDLADKQMLENLSIHDPLTGAVNRRAFDMAVKKHLERTIKSECAMLFIDIDYFKTVNDNYGHEAGDKVLAEFASLLKELFGETSIISRYGGDEFLVFISEAYKPKIEFLMSELRRRVHEIKPITQKENDTFVVSCSCGGALCPDDAKDFEMLKKCADAALYEVKEMGRDGYRWYGGRDTDDGPIQ